MLRLLSLAALLLLAGCAGPAAVDEVAPIAPEPDWRVTAQRVEPDPHELHWRGQVGIRPCAIDGSEDCRSTTIVQSPQPVTVGLTYDEPTLPVRDATSLFWRVNARLEWTSDDPMAPALQLQVRTITDGLEGRSRIIETFEGASPLVVEAFDVFLREHEVGIELALVVETGAMMESTASDPIQFEVTGAVNGYHPVGEPILVS